MSHRENMLRIKVVHRALEELSRDVIFVGGAIVSLYADRPVSEVRPTDDIDIIIELIDYRGYAAIDEQLRQKGFLNDAASGVICRYIVQGIIVDVMPTSENVLGFANKWYPEAAKNSIQQQVEDNFSINIFPSIYFLATKLEAFKNRGQNDGRFSNDFEDIVYILNNRNSIWEEMEKAPENLHQYLRDEFTKLLSVLYIDEWISAHLDYQEQKRVKLIIGGLISFTEENSTKNQ